MALYLKYRPQDFSSLVGQTFIKETLKKAVSQDKTVGAYLFTGPRGTGKTSTARIFAKAINCENPKDGDPCGSCNICSAFADNSLIDIIEIDAASHTGVDNIREIIEKAQFSPTQTKYKIYIIDEVHMLSKGAFNALLKILEEPPKHIKFILATTEIHKVPETILSRCQRYDFRNFSDEDMTSRLEYIASEEGVEVDAESYKYIVKNAGGGMRNAVSLFEQLISDGKISFEKITQTLGIASEDEKKNFLDKMLKKDASLLEDFGNIKTQGKDLKNFIKEITHLLSSNSIEKVKKSENVDDEIILLDILQDTLMKTKNSFDESLTIQISLLKVLNGNPIQSRNPVAGNKATNETPAAAQAPVQSPVNPPKQEIPQDSMIQEAQDIFASSQTPIQEVKASSTNSSGGNFDIEAFLKAVKNNGGKAAATMSLRGSAMSLNEGILSIQTKTKVSLATLQKAETQDAIFAASKEINLEIGKLEIS